MPAITLAFPAGVQRDGTRLDALRCVDALWCRWRLGRPRKMGGYKAIGAVLAGGARKLHAFYTGGQIIIHAGTGNGLQQVIIDTNGNVLNQSDRTPSGFLVGSDVGWSMDSTFDTTSNVVQFIAHSVPDQEISATAVTTTPLIGPIDAQTRLVPFGNPNININADPLGAWTQPSVSGGVFTSQPYTFCYGSQGLIQWSAPNLPLYLGVTQGVSGAGQARISAQKLVAGMALRGGGSQSPAGLVWSLSELIMFTFVGGLPTFAFSTISPSSSILGKNTVIEYDSQYYWCGTDRFLLYNGVVNEIQNTQNQDWFFDNLTKGYEARTFAFKVPRYGEIWWCAAMFGSTEPNHAIIYNVREQAWYDTSLPSGGRTAAYFAQGLRFPIMTQASLDANAPGYKMWMHETGVDMVDYDGSVSPVRSYFETSYLGGPKADPPNDQSLSIQQLEPDLNQTGDMIVSIVGSPNVRAQDVTTASVTIKQTPSIPQEQLVSFKTCLRLLRLRIESNAIGGNYVCGRSLLHVGYGDVRKVG